MAWLSTSQWITELQHFLPEGLKDYAVVTAIFTLGSSLLVVSNSVSWVQTLINRYKLSSKRKQRQLHCKNAIDRLSKKLKEDEVSLDEANTITKLSLQELKKKVENGSLRHIEVLYAYQAKALSIHAETNCLVEPIEEAEEQLKSLNTHGLLAGIPISLKDDIAIAGYSSAVGRSSRGDVIMTKDCAFLKVLKQHGAIPFVKTNIPQLGLSIEPGNPINGTVMNPHDLTRNPGGSSSGEGALIGAGGSLLGFGSDLGGSLRSPAHSSGCCSFKSTSQRVSHLGMTPLLLTQSEIPVTWGPLARDIDTIILAMQALWDGSMSKEDPLCPPLIFNNQDLRSDKRLRIGYFYDDGLIPAVPACRRAVDMAVKKLEEQGHEVIEWTPPNGLDTFLLETTVLFADGGREILKSLENDSIDKSILLLYVLTWLPTWLKKFLASVIPLKLEAGNVASTIPKSAHEYWEASDQVRKFSRKVTDEWSELGLDAVVSPVMSCPALQRGQSDIALRCATYMMLYNIVNFPAGCVPMTRVTENDVGEMKDYPATCRTTKIVKQGMIGAEGLPVGVQVAALRWKDETCLRVMKEVEEASDF